ncbi:MAG: DUF6642 family protein [Saprospiraceae bacterium]
MSTKKKFIYCLDTFWGEDFSEKAQVLSILKFLQEIHDIEFFYWRCATYEEFKYHLQNTIINEKSLAIWYLAFHGEPNKIWVGEKGITLGRIAKIGSSAFKNNIVHFGSCETLSLNENKIQVFLGDTGAKAVSGYTKSIDFVESAALDILYFYCCWYYGNINKTNEYMSDKYRSLIDSLGFKIFHR